MNIRRQIDRDIFRNFLKEKGVSIRLLDKICISSERTIRYMIRDGYVTLPVAIDICQHLDCTLDEAFGKDDSQQWKDYCDTIHRLIT